MKRREIFGCQEAAELLGINKIRVHQLIKLGILTAEEWGCEAVADTEFKEDWKPVNELINKKIARKKLKLEIEQVLKFKQKYEKFKSGESQRLRYNQYLREYMRRLRNNEPTRKNDWDI